MAKQKEPKEPKKNKIMVRDIDPEVERKVDVLMTGKSDLKEPVQEAQPSPKKQPKIEDGPVGAPLLPTDKLPLSIKVAAEPEPKLEPTVEAVPEPEPTIKMPEEGVHETEVIDPVKAALTPEPAEPDRLGLDSPETAKAVDDILAEEADTLLDVQDAVLPEEVPTIPQNKKGFGDRLKDFFRAWWHSPLYRWGSIVALLIVIGACAAMPTSRYFVLNSAGVRVATSLTVLDQNTIQPLKNVEVSVSGQTAKTDKDGKVRLDHIKLGTQTVTVKKAAFAELSKKITFGWGSNPLGEFKLTPVGSQYTFVLTDFLSGKPVTKNVEASSGESSARANNQGEAVLTVPEGGLSEIQVTITADDYRTENLTLPVSTKDSQILKLVPASKHVFVSKRSGKLDVYKVDIDGKNEEKIFPGTGKENPDTMALVAHPANNVAAFVSTRGEAKNQDGFLLSTLTLIDVDSAKTTKVADSERIQVIDWIGDKLVYVRVAQGASAADVNRNRLMAYDYKTGEDKQLASTNYFNDVMVANGAVYYSPAVYQVNGTVGLFRINADGTNKKTVYDKEVWNLFRTAYDKITLSVGQDWYEYSLTDDKVSKISGGATPSSRIYSESPDKMRSIWVDERDGKGVLLSYEYANKEDKTLHTQSGIKNPIYWLDSDHVVYRVKSGQEIADYVMSISGGEPLKVRDVTDIAGVDRWYYY
jgi:hypothetical protein